MTENRNENFWLNFILFNGNEAKGQSQRISHLAPCSTEVIRKVAAAGGEHSLALAVGRAAVSPIVARHAVTVISVAFLHTFPSAATTIIRTVSRGAVIPFVATIAIARLVEAVPAIAVEREVRKGKRMSETAPE